MAKLLIVKKPPDVEAIDHYKEAVQRYQEQHARLVPLSDSLKERADKRSKRTGKYLKWLWLYADGIRTMLPTADSAGVGVAILPMLAMSTRAILECALALQFYGMDEVSDDESTFRRMYFLALFDARDDAIRDAGTEWNTGVRPAREFAPTPATEAMSRTQFFKALEPSQQRRLLKFPTDATFATHTPEEVAVRFGISSGRYRALQRLMSQFSHFLPYAMIRMARVGDMPGGFALELTQFLNEAADILELAARGAESVAAQSPT